MITERPLFSWALKYNRGLQGLLVLLIVVAVFLRVLPLEMQKRIVNTAIGLEDLHALFIYCGFYLAAVVLAGLLKYVINVLQGYIGQKVLFEMRTQLYDHILQLPLPFFRKTPAGMVISSLTSELASVGVFLGSALAVPIINGLTLLAFAGYMLHLNPLLAVVSLSIYPLEILVIPVLQKRFNELNRDRVDTTRLFSNVIGEAVSGIHEVHGNGSYPIENEKFGRQAARLFNLRHRMNIYKFGIKFTNNFFQNMGPFILFLLGGYLAIEGRFDLGALVAFLSAYEKLYDPWKELMDYYQAFQDSRVRYRRVMEYFEGRPEFVLKPTGRKPYELQGAIEVQDLSYLVDENTTLLEGVSLSVQPGEQLAVVGFSGSGKSTLAMILGQLYSYHRGHVLIDGTELKGLSKLDVNENVGYISQFPFIFEGTIRENLLYGCQALVLAEAGSARALPDYNRVLELVHQVGLADDVLRFGLNTVLSHEYDRDLVSRLIKVRLLFHQRWAEALAQQVEFFDLHQYMRECSVRRNILFGEPLREDFEFERLPTNQVFRNFLSEVELIEPLLSLGINLAKQTVLLLRDLGDDAFFFEASPIPREQLPRYSQLVDRLTREGKQPLSSEDERLLLLLALHFTPARHKMVALSEELEKRILAARLQFIANIGKQDLSRCYLGIDGMSHPELMDPEKRQASPDFMFYCPFEFLYGQSILNNVLFGRVKRDQPDALEEVQRLVVQLLEEENLLEKILDLGLDFQVGSKGDRLSGGQKQKIALARGLLKDPHILILDEATASLDNTSQARVQELLKTQLRGKTTVVAVVHRLDMVQDYDQIVLLKTGKIAEIGTYKDLMARKGAFYELVQGN
ncbi:MAG: ABC transporter ATP-binding protein/permease [Deltaproteobacteria bacterium]|nr:ABC transporter ATP-binding protein/permease [Deltaproteobacteria bacterium]MBW2069854.1 ABC transporter ATP-binding protein/permease [Deltaproteobacteria bacterium]